MTRFSDAFDVAAHNARARAGWDKPAAPAKGQPSPEYAFRHLRAKATPDAIPPLPTLAEALGC